MKKIIKSICFSVLALLFAIGSFFVPLTSKNINSANADVVDSNYSFDGSSIVTLMGSVRSGVGYYLGFINFDVSLTNEPSSVKVDLNLKYYSLNIAYGSNTNSFSVPKSSSYNNNYNFLVNTTSDYVSFAIACDSDFNCNIYKVRIYSTSENLTNYNRIYTYINYYDVNDNIISFRIACTLTDPEQTYIANYFTYSDRTYYFLTNLDTNQYYNSGYNAGLLNGYDNGYNIGYSDGNSSGYNEGYDEGLIDGAVNANDYSFFGLISAVIDTPIQLFKSLFNFNFLGVNLFAFFTSILTIGLIVFVTKMFLRR